MPSAAGAGGSGVTRPGSFGMSADGTISRTCWNAQRLKGAVRQLARVAGGVFIRINRILKNHASSPSFVLLLSALIALPALGTDMFAPAVPALTDALRAPVSAGQF